MARFRDVLEEETDDRHKDFIGDIDISSGEDEEIDEDMAFDEEDEERYGDNFARSSNKTKRKEDEVDEIFDEIEDGEEEYDEEDLLGDEDENDEKVTEWNFEEEKKPEPLKKKQKIDLNSLASVITEEKGLMNLRKGLERLENEKTKKMAVKPPLAPIIQEQIDRKVAYKQASKQISKWLPIIKANREAEHLSFPLNEPAPSSLPQVDIVSSTKPEKALETEIASILKRSNMDDEKKILEAEQLALNKYTLEEAAERKAELQKMRALLFYQEQKMKRMAKIKSKTYRKILKKEKEKLKENGQEEEDGEEARLAAEYLRAKERMSLKHKSKIQKKSNYQDTQKAVAEQYELHQKLTAKIEGTEETDSEDEDVDLDNDEDGVDFKEKAIAALETIAQDSTEAPKKGLFAMKFMQRAAEKKKQETIKMMEEIKKELEGSEEEISESEDEPSEEKKNFEEEKTIEKAVIDSKLLKPKESHKISINVTREEKENDGTSSNGNVWLTSGHALQSTNIKKTQSNAEKSSLKTKKKLMDLPSGKVKTDTIESTIESITENSKEEIFFADQKELVKMAFANDDVVREFEDEKNRIIDEETAKPEDVTLPGWGTWGGSSLPASKVRVIKLPEKNAMTDPKKRKDYNLSHVIINEKKMKKVN